MKQIEFWEKLVPSRRMNRDDLDLWHRRTDIFGQLVIRNNRPTNSYQNFSVILFERKKDSDIRQISFEKTFTNYDEAKAFASAWIKDRRLHGDKK